jgi:phosphoribosylglycinamide formyltransferase-1
MKYLAIFASGSGTNAQNIIEYFNEKGIAEVSLILSNDKDAYVLERARKHNIPTVTFNRKTFYETDVILDLLREKQIDLVVLAGFLWMIPGNLLRAFPNGIVNIHPALLPNYGGKGFYGMKVHESVIAAGEKESGITIHYVNEHYDAGQIIFQATCPVLAEDTPESLAIKVHALEYAHFPRVIAELFSYMKIF